MHFPRSNYSLAWFGDRASINLVGGTLSSCARRIPEKSILYTSGNADVSTTRACSGPRAIWCIAQRAMEHVPVTTCSFSVFPDPLSLSLSLPPLRFRYISLYTYVSVFAFFYLHFYLLLLLRQTDIGGISYRTSRPLFLTFPRTYSRKIK